ncbi:MAG TPA: DUF2244 domain-containing protein [Acetobacteraceae bacterium]
MEPVLFEAVIVPYRSLSPRGLRILTGVICGLCALTTLRFLLIRAWPVIGFSVVEVGLAVGLLWFNLRRGRQSEIVLLTEAGLEIVRTDTAGRKHVERLTHGWLNVVLQEQAGRVPRLLLVARQQQREIAAWLGEEEKRDLAMALRDALDRMRHPVFDNPQLREGPGPGG